RIRQGQPTVTLQKLQRTDRLQHIKIGLLRKGDQIKVKCQNLTSAISYLIIIVQMMVDLLDKKHGRKTGLQRIPEPVPIFLLIQQYRKSLLAIPSGTSGFLVIGLQRIGDVQVDHKTYISLVYSHAERIRGHNDPDLVVCPDILLLLPILDKKSRMVIIEWYTVIEQIAGYLLCLPSVAHVDHTCAAHFMDDTQHPAHFVFLIQGHITQIGAGEAHFQYIRSLKVKLLLYIVHDAKGCRSRQGQY